MIPFYTYSSLNRSFGLINGLKQLSTSSSGPNSNILYIENTIRYLFIYKYIFYTLDTVMFGIGYIIPRFSEDHFPIGFQSELLVQACSERPEQLRFEM